MSEKKRLAAYFDPEKRGAYCYNCDGLVELDFGPDDKPLARFECDCWDPSTIEIEAAADGYWVYAARKAKGARA